MGNIIKAEFRIDPEAYRSLEELNKRLGTPNVATAIYSAVQILNRLFEYENQGYEIAAVDKHGLVTKIDLPKGRE